MTEFAKEKQSELKQVALPPLLSSTQATTLRTPGYATRVQPSGRDNLPQRPALGTTEGVSPLTVKDGSITLRSGKEDPSNDEIVRMLGTKLGSEDNCWQDTAVRIRSALLKDRSSEVRAAVIEAREIGLSSFRDIKDEQLQLIALQKLRLDNEYERDYLASDYLLQDAVSPRVKVEIAKQFPLTKSQFYILIHDLAGQPELQTELLKAVDSIEPGVFGWIRSVEGQRAAVTKIHFENGFNHGWQGPDYLLGAAFSDDVKLEIARRYPPDLPVEATYLISTTKEKPELQLELIRSVKQIYPIAFADIKTAEGQRLAVSKLCYPSTEHLKGLSSQAAQEFKDWADPRYMKRYREVFSPAALEKAALSDEVRQLIRQKSF